MITVTNNKHLPDFTLSAGALLLLSALIFFDRDGLLIALVPGVIAHETGHALAVALLGGQVRLLAVSASGLRMDYSGAVDGRGEAAACLAGPAMGLLYALAASRTGTALGSDYLLCSAGLSLVLSLYNLLPASSLDGGRIMELALEQKLGGDTGRAAMFALSIVVGVALVVVGILLLTRGYGFALIPAGLWIIILQFRDKE